jgi:hypothetical protein
MKGRICTHSSVHPINMLDCARAVLSFLRLFLVSRLGTVGEMTTAFQLPALEDYFVNVDGSPRPDDVVDGWFGGSLRTTSSEEDDDDEGDAEWAGALPVLPTLRSLAPLPREYWELVRRVESAVCPSDGELMGHPTLCLVCGEVVCSLCGGESCRGRISVHGREVERGACNVHAKHCSGGSGMFLCVKKAVVALIDGDRGVQIAAPCVCPILAPSSRLRIPSHTHTHTHTHAHTHTHTHARTYFLPSLLLFVAEFLDGHTGMQSV